MSYFQLLWIIPRWGKQVFRRGSGKLGCDKMLKRDATAVKIAIGFPFNVEF